MIVRKVCLTFTLLTNVVKLRSLQDKQICYENNFS